MESLREQFRKIFSQIIESTNKQSFNFIKTVKEKLIHSNNFLIPFDIDLTLIPSSDEIGLYKQKSTKYIYKRKRIQTIKKKAEA